MTLRLPRPNVQINPGRLGPPRLTPKEEQALAEVSDPVLRRTLGEMFLAARGNQENFDRLAQEFPIQLENLADDARLPQEGEPGEVLTVGEDGTLGWEKPAEAEVNYFRSGPNKIIELNTPANGVLKVVKELNPEMVPRHVLHLAFQFDKSIGLSERWAGVAPAATGGSGESSKFPQWRFNEWPNDSLAMRPYSPPYSLSFERAKEPSERQRYDFFYAIGALATTVASSAQSAIASGEKPSLEVTLPENCVVAWAAIVRPGIEVASARSDQFITRQTGKTNVVGEPSNEGQFDIQQVVNPVAGKHTFSWNFAKATGEQRIIWQAVGRAN